ncbi:MAG TPA: SIS domain-containing protein [Alphaproteobacteria bacterium]|nr:phosphoheptose isomerase [Rhodospirillaceae bacterium]HRJ13282.1 SIS domain-containing protein [Alphaproteobacteria bacterium]
MSYPLPKSLNDYLHQSVAVIQATMDDENSLAMNRAIESTVTALRSGKALLTCGNGGSAADASHIAGEMVGRFFIDRKPYNVVCLSDNSATITSIANDFGYEHVFAQQVKGLGSPGTVLLGISTSGNSKNVVNAMIAAKELGMITIGMTGQGGGKMAELSDILLAVPSKVTPIIQQVHQCWYHYFCMMVEDTLK